MQKNKASYLMIAFFILAFIALFIVAYNLVHRSHVTPEKIKQHMVLMVDFNNDGILNQQELLDSEDAILAVRLKDKKDQLFNGINALQQLDLNKDGRIDKKDPIFPQLELIFFTNKGKTRKYVPIEKAKIQTIILTKQEFLNDEKSEQQTVGYALTTDGKKLQIHLISVATE